MKKLIVGSRGSLLATTQAKQTIKVLKKINPEIQFELKIVETAGDLDSHTELTQFADLGIFVKELQIALLKGEIDCAIHSLKDVPEEQPQELQLVSFPFRENAADVYISKNSSFWDLPSGAKVGTGSPRRVMQLKKHKPQVKFLPVRGNLDTRIDKVLQGELDGIVLAAAGIHRLGWGDKIKHYFSIDQMIPAIGQASLALECRVDQPEIAKVLKSVNDPFTEIAVRFEREYMSRLGGGCKVPLACHALVSGDDIKVWSCIGHPETMESVSFQEYGMLEDLEELLDRLVKQTEEVCKAKQIPLPRELPKHHLLQTGFSKKVS